MMDGANSPSPYRIITTLRRTERSLASTLDAAVSAVDLTGAQFHVLEELTVTSVLHSGELAWRHRVTRQSMQGSSGTWREPISSSGRPRSKGFGTSGSRTAVAIV